jgi:hypothetical protein
VREIIVQEVGWIDFLFHSLSNRLGGYHDLGIIGRRCAVSIDDAH